MDRNKMKRKIAMMLCVCVLFASSAPLALAEATSSEPQVAATTQMEGPTMGDTADASDTTDTSNTANTSDTADTGDNNKNEPDGDKNKTDSPTGDSDNNTEPGTGDNNKTDSPTSGSDNSDNNTEPGTGDNNKADSPTVAEPIKPGEGGPTGGTGSATPGTQNENKISATASADIGKISVDIYNAASDKELTVTLLDEGGSNVGQKTITGKGILTFENLSAGKYTVTVNYTTSVEGVSEVKIEELAVYDKEHSEPLPTEQIEATATVSGQTISISATKYAEGSTLKATLSTGEQITLNKGQGEFTNVPAGVYSVTVSYDGTNDGQCVIKELKVETQSIAQAISATASTDIGKISVDIYNAASDKELTVTLLDEKDSRVGQMTTTGKGILVFENLSAGKYKVKVNYTTPVAGVSEVEIGELSVYDKEHPEPLPTEQIEATATVSGQTIGISATKYAEGSTLKATLNPTGQQITLNKGQGEFTNVPAGVYSVIVSYDGTDDGQCVIKELKVETQSIAQAITATATAGVKRIDVDVTAASPMSVVVTLMQNGQPKDTRSIAAGVGKVSFENLAAGTYSVSVNYAPAQTGVAATVIDNLNVTEENVKIAIGGVTPGENKLTVSGTAKPNEPVMISTVPDGGSTIVNAGADGKFSAELARTAGTYTEVSAQYVSDAASRVTLKGTFVVTGTVTKPGLEVDDLYNNSLTVVAKTTAGVTVYLKTGDYEQTLVADNRGIVRFTLPHTYAQGTRFTLTVYYGAGNSMSYNVEATVGGTPYYKLFKRGSRGDGVYALTSRLSEMGYPVSPTNYYSDSVAAAVRLFQSANGLSADGMAGKLTQEKLYSVSAIGYSESGQTYPTLVRGDRGMALLYTLQQRLKDLGYYTIRVDGIFGSGTQRAVRWFQSVNGLSVTGKADNATQQLLYSAQAKAASGYSPDSYDTLSRSNRYKAAVVPLQRRLKALGYLSGSADGYFGSNTYRAVRNFQSRNGLSVTGVADSGTQQLLYSSSARPASGSSSSGSGTSTGYRLLYWGCRGDAVKRLQQALIDAGYKSYVRSADGIYGQWTYDAVRAYQRDVGLSVDGIAGKNTQNKLYGTKY